MKTDLNNSTNKKCYSADTKAIYKRNKQDILPKN